VFWCSQCDQRFASAIGNNDILHVCTNGDEAIDFEDVVVVGEWSDYTGSGGGPTNSFEGVVNELQGTTAGVMGQRFSSVTSRGNRKSTHRTRRRIVFKDLTKERSN